MKTVRYTILAVAVIGIFFSEQAFSQATGDYRSIATGNWSEASTWETFNGASWIAATNAPAGTETITVRGVDTVRVDVAVSISGYVKVEETGIIEVSTGSLTFGDGSTYEHARDAGSVPTAVWETGSTALFTGITGTAPDNRGQDYYNLTLNTPNLASNRDLSLNDHTIGGDITVINTGSARWQLVGGSSGTVTIMGDVIVQAGQFATQGTGSATDVVVDHYGNLNVTGGNFSISRGSQGSGTGTTTWNLYKGDFSMSNATTQNSNPTPGNAKFVFAKKDTQQITFENVTYAGRVHFEISDSTTLQIAKDFVANGNFVNRGAIETVGTLTFADGAVYEHARDGGDVPTAVWEAGSTALFTGVTSTAPGNRGQDYYNLTLNTPGLSSNRDLNLNGRTIGGDLTLISTGSARWQMVGGSSGIVTIMGDVIVQDGQFTSQGTSSATDVVVDHYGNVVVTGGNFSVARGSQGSGTGSTRWYLHEGNFSMSNATTQNSNATNAWFVFDKKGTQTLTLGAGNTLTALPIEVNSGTTLDIGSSLLAGSGIFTLHEGATLASGHPNGIDGNLQTSGDMTLSKAANFTFNGTVAQVPGALLPDSVNVLTISNSEGVSFNDTLRSVELVVSSGAIMKIDTLGSVTADTGSVAGAVVNKGLLASVKALVFGDGSVYEHARDGGSVPSAVWEAGSTALFTGITSTAPGNRGQDYYNLTLKTPGLSSNRDLSLQDHTIGGDITVMSTGSARWQMVGGSSGTVTIMGDVIVQDGQFTSQGTSSATDVVVDHYGNVVVTGGNFSVARGSQGSGTGSTRWYLHEGNFSMSNATTQNSNATNAWFVFDKQGTQTLTLGAGNTLTALPIEVNSGTTLDMGASALAGSGIFTLNEGATLMTALAGGIDEVFNTVTGTVTLAEGASYGFNGTTAQVTSSRMPTTVNDLLSNNPAGLTLSQATTINGKLRLMAGVFDNTIPFTLGPNGSISYEGGSLKFTTAVDEQSPKTPTEFALFQNYPNPFSAKEHGTFGNPSTTIRYDLPKRTHVTLKIYDIMGHLVAELVNGELDAGTHQAEWNALGYANGVYYYRISAGDFTSVRKLVLMK